jgi:hypothetical protein
LLDAQQCHPIGGVGTCFDPCENDLQCLLGACTGMADDSARYCQTAAEQPCETDGDCAGSQRCDLESGACYCTDDVDCSGQNAACDFS